MDADTSWELFYKKIFVNNSEGTNREIGAQLWKGQKGRRSLVLIHDICNAEAGEDFRIFSPNDCNVCRLLPSSRDLNVSKYANQNYPLQELSVRGVDTSWQLLSKKIFFSDSESTCGEVGAQLWKGLKGRRYLAVIDEILDVKAWEILRTFFPKGSNGSQILFTSRDVDVGKYVHPNDPVHELNQMDPDPSSELLSKDLFLRYFCSKSLVSIGKSIAVKCQGLPVTINLIARHLSNVGRTPMDWLNVETNFESLENRESDILASSYDHLPQHLKLCFLFTAYEYAHFCKRLHPESSFQEITTTTIPNSEMKIREVIREIMTMQSVRSEMAMLKSARPGTNQHFGMSTQRLLRLWIAAGFIAAESARTLEDVAEDYLDELISRNLVMVTKTGSRGRPKKCIVHDLTIEMCRRLDVEISGMIGNHSDELYPFALFGDRDMTDKLLQSIKDFSNTKLKHLRYLEISTSSTIAPSLFRFCNLQTFIVHHPIPGETLPRDIWMMSQLRHLHLGDSCHFSSPRRPYTREVNILILKKLQSVTLSSASCTREVFEGMPNLRRLKLNEVRTDSSSEQQSLNCLNNIIFLKQLQSLRLSLQNLPRCLQHWQNPPPNIKKVTLARSCLSGEDISMLASLSNLEILKLVDINLQEEVLEHDDKIFRKLKFLLLNCPNLRIWKAELINFPRLQHLVFKNYIYLSEIPLEIGDICTLKVIELHNSSSLPMFVVIHPDQLQPNSYELLRSKL